MIKKNETKKRIDKLVKEINHHRYLYHVLDKQEISDAALDSLKHELNELERDFPEFIRADSPTQRVGGKPLDKFSKAPHLIPMLSFNDVFSISELEDWEKRIKKIVPREEFDYFVEVKIDGFAISLEYEKGFFSRGSTRGDGRIGEEVSQNLKTIESIPLRLAKDLTIEMRGEVYMDKKEFERINKERKKNQEPLYANPRNTAAGSIRQLDPKIAANRKLSFMAYGVATDFRQQSHAEEHKLAKELGFKVDEHARVCKDLTEVEKFWQDVQKFRNKLPYQIDGIVVMVNNKRVFEKLGVVGKAPRGAVAFKFPAEQTTTIVEDIIVQVGRTGALTPVAVLKPVSVAGSTISRATLHNDDEIKRKDVRIGDTVIIQKAGDVIPEVVEVLTGLRTGQEKKFSMPKNCPVCGKKTERKDGEAVSRCTNSDCFAQNRRRLIHFVSKSAFNIVGLGPQIIEQLIENGLVREPADFFKLNEGDLIPLERFADKSAGNLVGEVSERKEIDLERFIFSLGIRHIGEVSAQDLAKYTRRTYEINNIGDLIKIMKDIKPEELRNIEGVGGIVAESLCQWFHNEKNIKLLNGLEEVGVKIKKPQSKTKKQVFKGEVFVLTGELESMARDKAKSLIREAGGKVSSSVSQKTDYVVAGDSPGSKLQKAQKLGIKILTEKEFLKKIT